MSFNNVTLDRKNCGVLLASYAALVQKAGAFPKFQEAALMADACAYFDDTVKTKPEFEEEGDPETLAIKYLIIAVHRGQVLNPCPFNFTDTKLIYEILKFCDKEYFKDNKDNKDTASSSSRPNPEKANKEIKEKRERDGKAAKAAALSARQASTFDDDEDEDTPQSKVSEVDSDEEDLKEVTRKSSKGKERA